MRDARQSSPVMALLLAVVAAGMAVSAFFLPAGQDGTASVLQPDWLSNVLSLLTLLAVAVSLNYVNSNNFQFSSPGCCICRICWQFWPFLVRYR